MSRDDPTAAPDAYRTFLEAKIAAPPCLGLPCELEDVRSHLIDGRPMKEHVRHIVRWAVQGGRRGIFANFGLHKTMMQLEIGRIITSKVGCLGMIVMPLGVRREFKIDAALLDIDVEFIRSNEDLDAALAAGTHPRLFLTNYESVREGKIDVERFGFVSLDEASVLRSYGSKTYQEFLPLFVNVPYRFVATATPSPNRYKELIHYAGFLGIMDTGQALTRFFQRNSEKANDLTLYPHKEAEFWLWLNSWGVFLQKPSDLGFSDEGYDLPPLTVRYHSVACDLSDAGVEDNGQHRLIRNAALGVVDAAREKRATLETRIAKVKEIVEAAPGEHFLVWHDLEDERKAIEECFPRRRWRNWGEYKDGNAYALALYERHYSAYKYADGRERKLFAGPGEKTVLMTDGDDAMFVWRKFISDDSQEGVNCAIFRNEGRQQSSALILEAECVAWQRWPGQRLYTYVNAKETASRRGKTSEPGKCFIEAGWTKCGETKGGLIILEKLSPSPETPDIAPTGHLGTVYGTQDLDKREEIIADFADGRIPILAAKPVMLGSGTNLQRHCHRAIFAGVGFKFNDLIQSIHRLHRFLQDEPVEIDIIHAETETEVLRSLQEKWERHNELTARMSEIIRQYGLNHEAAAETLKRSIGCERVEAAGEKWRMVNNDCVEEVHSLADDSVDLVVTSIPFGNHYEYSASYNDFGHTDDHDHFFEQMDFLTPELLRILKPGRVAAVHVKDRIRFAGVTGMTRPTVEPFHADTIAHFRRHGFGYMGLRFIATDVVRENNQTYRLTYKELRKDSSKMGSGSPEFLLLFFKLPTDRSNGYADEPVTKDPDEYSLARWQIDADSLWRSSGDRPVGAADMALLTPDALARLFPAWSIQDVYDHEAHVAIGEALASRNALPKTFSVLKPGCMRDDVWTDIVRMRTLNSEQVRRRVEQHICPLQFDIVDRAIRLYSNPGELVFDPFAGLGTVPMRAVALGRRGLGVELNPESYRDAVHYCGQAEREASVPSLFELMAAEDAVAP